MKKRISAILLTLAMILSLMPMTALADGTTAGNTNMSGDCGATGSESDVTWKLEQNNQGGGNPTYTLTISGTGAMADYNSNIGRDNATQPWRTSQTGIDVKAITKIVVGQGVTKIGAFAFNGITNVTGYDIATTVETIGDWGIDIYSAERFILNGNENYTVDGDGVLLTADGKTLIAYPGGAEPRDSYTIPDTVETVASGAFVGCDAAKLVIPSNVTSLPQWSFSSGTIQEIVCNANMAALPESVFSGIATLEKISFGSAIKTLSKLAVSNCAKLHDVTLPDGLTSIENQAFLNCTALSEIEFPEGLTTIGDQAFSHCSALAALVFPDSLTTIGPQAFINCTALSRIEFPASLQSIGNQAFMGCSALSCIEFPASLQSIGYQTFMNCTALSGIEFSEGLTTIGNGAFSGCSALTALVFPDSLTEIGMGAFDSCTGLKYVVHGSGIDDIGSGAFSGCTSLRVIDIHRAEKIGEVWNNGLRPNGDYALNYACQRTLQNVCYYMRSETQAKNAKGDIEWSSAGKDTGNTTNTYYVLTAEDAVPDYSATTNIPQRTGYTFSGWKKVTVDSTIENVYTDDGQWQENSYEADEGTATITQRAGDTSNGSATLKAPEALAYDGQPKVAVVETTGTWTGGENVTYAKKGESEYTDNAPVAAGTYTAKLTVGEGETAVTVSVEFEITQARPTVNISADKTSLPGGGLVKLTVSGVPEGGTVTVTQTDDQGSDTKALGLTGNGNISVSLGNTTATYTFTVFYAGDNNHASDSDKCTVSVTYMSSGISSFGSSVTTTATANGTLTVTPSYAAQGTTVTITPIPHADYELASLTVTDANGNLVALTANANGTYSFTMPASKVTVSASFSKVVKTLPFIDVPASAYYYDAVAWAVENGVTNGYESAVTFAPDVKCSRAEAVTFIWRAVGCPEPVTTEHPFTDVSGNAYYYKAVLWAVENGVTNGTGDGTTFSPDVKCSRAEIVTFLYRAAGSPAVHSDSGFADVNSNAYYANAVTWAVRNGITNGYDTAATFAPDVKCSRAEIVTFLYRDYAD